MKDIKSFLAGKKLLAIFPHPDDEAFSCSGLLYYHTSLGNQASLICLTRGESASLGQMSKDLGEQRLNELRNSAKLLGISSIDCPGFKDSQLSTEDGLKDYLAEKIKEMNPQIIISFCRDGAYGHIDHVHLTKLLISLLQSNSTIDFLGAAFPKAMFLPLFKRLRRYRNGQLADKTLMSEDFGFKAEEADFTLSYAEMERIKSASIACHKSQLKSCDILSLLYPVDIRPLLKIEYYKKLNG